MFISRVAKQRAKYRPLAATSCGGYHPRLGWIAYPEQYLGQILCNGCVALYLLFTDDLVFMSESPQGLQKLICENFCSQWHILGILRKLKWYSMNDLQVQVPVHLCSMVTKCQIVNITSTDWKERTNIKVARRYFIKWKLFFLLRSIVGSAFCKSARCP